MIKSKLLSGTLPATPQRRTLSLLSDYLTLTKPRVVSLLLITAVGGMFLAAEGVPPIWVLVLVLLGGALGAGGANALNHYLDRDIDEKMFRTRRRPVPGHRIEPGHALVFGVLLNAIAFTVLAAGVNLISALLTLGASLFYVLVYTLWLKRSTPQNIVIGGAAGAVPPLVGWAGVTGEVSLPALYLFAIIFFWTPPHFWALALLLKGDYARAGIPMLPVVRSVSETALGIILHSAAMVTITILFFTTEAVGWLYLWGAVALGAIFLVMALRLWSRPDLRKARELYLFSMLYLAVLFAFIMVDSSLGL